MKLIVLSEDRAALDPDDVAYVVALTEEQKQARREPAETQVVFKNGRYLLLTIPFEDLCAALEKVIRADG